MATQLEIDCVNKSYANAGNKALLQFLSPNSNSILDIGCGSGDNARLVKSQRQGAVIHGITLSEDELAKCADVIDECVIYNVEEGIPPAFKDKKYDTIIFSHVLEHLSKPSKTVEQYAQLLNPGGQMLIAVPNVLIYSQRLKFLLGKFEYTESGTMDMTHLRFFTYKTAAQYLTADIKSNISVETSTEGAVPVWKLRKIIPGAVMRQMDGFGCRLFPNLFGFQILVKITFS